MDISIGRILFAGKLVGCSVEVGEDDHRFKGDPSGQGWIGVLDVVIGYLNRLGVEGAHLSQGRGINRV